jgi:hypothetical protein
MIEIGDPSYTIKDGMLILLEDFTYEDMHIKEGYKWDGASIPKVLENCFGSKTSPNYVLATLIHDYVYGSRTKSKKWADRIFFRLLIREGTAIHKAIYMYLAVRWFGIFGWWLAKFRREERQST